MKGRNWGSMRLDEAIRHGVGHGLTTDETFTYVALVHHADYTTGDRCYPSQKRLKAATGLSIATLTRVLKSLESKGWIYRKMHAGPGGNTIYKLSGGDRAREEVEACLGCQEREDTR